MADKDFENINPGERKVWVQEGLYPAKAVSYKRLKYSFKGRLVEKVVIGWKVFISSDLSTGVILSRYYNLERDRSKRLHFGHHHAYRHDWVRANNNKEPLEREKIPPEKFEEGLFLVKVVTVTEGQDGEIPSSMEWSRIGRVERPIKDGEQFKRLPLEPHDSLEQMN